MSALTVTECLPASGDQRPVERLSIAVSLRPPGMMTMGEAIRRTLNSEHYEGKREREAARTWLRRLIRNNGKLELVERSGARIWVHPKLHAALSEPPRRERIPETLNTLQWWARENLATKLRVLSDLRIFRQTRRLGWVDARRRFCDECAGFYRRHVARGKRIEQQALILSPPTVATWQRLFRDGGADALAVDGRGRYERWQPHPEAVALYWNLRSDPNRRTMPDCWAAVAAEARQHHWPWFEKRSTCQAWDKRTRNQQAIDARQKSDSHYTAENSPYVEQDPESHAPGECSIQDDTTVNAWVVFPDGEVIRPTLSAVMDWRSRFVGGWCPARTGNEQAAVRAYAMHADRVGLSPKHVTDNGKNFSSVIWRGDKPKRREYRNDWAKFAERHRGIFELAGITVNWSLPYNPNGKARIERFFKTLNDKFFRWLPSYTGNTPDDRPGEHKDLIAKAVPWDEIAEKLGRFIELYNNTPHTGEGMENRTPAQVLALAPAKHVIPDSVRPHLLSAWPRPVKRGRQGVAIRISGKTLRYGVFATEIRDIPIGTKVNVSYDPADVSRIFVWSDPDYRLLTPQGIELNERINRSLPGEALRESMRKIRHEKKALRKLYELPGDHLRDPVELALAGLAEQARPTGGSEPPPSPVLVPVRTPLQVPPKRKVVGAEDLETDVRDRIDAASRRAQRVSSHAETAFQAMLRKSREARGK